MAEAGIVTYAGWRAKLTREEQRWPWLATTVGRVDAYMGWRAYLGRQRQNYRLGLSPLEPRDAYLLVFIRDYLRAKGRPPTIEEIRRKMRWASSNTAWRRVRRLNHSDWLLRYGYCARGMSLTPKAKAFLAEVQ